MTNRLSQAAAVFLTLPLMTGGISAQAQGNVSTDPAMPTSETFDSKKVSEPAVAPRPVERGALEPSRPKPLDLSKRVIREAAAETEEKDDPTLLAKAGLFGAGTTARHQKTDQLFKDAEIPTCMTMDAWKFDPPRIGWLPNPGIFAAPWLVHAIATGKCRH